MKPQTSGLQSQRTLISAKPGKQEIDSIITKFNIFLGVYIMKQKSRGIAWVVFFVLALSIFQCGGGGDADPPDKPQGLTAAASSGQITLTWTALPGVAYDLFHSTAAGLDVGGANIMKISNVTSPYTHTGLTNGTVYYYRLTANNASGASEPSDEVPATPTPLAKPEGLEAEAFDGQVRLTWTVLPDVTYNLFHSTAAGLDVGGDNIMKISNATSPYTHTGLTNGTAYYYRLTANNASGASEPSDEVRATPSSGSGPSVAKPDGLVAEASNGQVRLTWTVLPDVTYDLFHLPAARLGVGGLNVGRADKISNVTSPYTHTGLTNGTTYYYRLTANTASGARSEPSDEVSVNLPPLAKPQNLAAAASIGQLTLTWEVLPGVTYNLFHSTTAGLDVGGASIMKISNVTSPYTHTGLTNRTAYYYRLTANNASGASEPSDEVSATTHTQIMISASNGHTCAVVDGVAKCWGSGGQGRLGDSTTTQRNTPNQVNSLLGGVTQVSTGSNYSCALLSNGAAMCWGAGGDGHIGNGDVVQRNAPVQVAGLTSGVTQISAGEGHTCAVVSGGAAMCWGSGGFGQLGHKEAGNETGNKVLPTYVAGLTSGVEQVSAGQLHTCSLVNGGAFCWGRNGDGQLGDGTITQRNEAAQVRNLTSGVTQISAGQLHTCAVVSGAARCWGANGSGQVGNGFAGAAQRSPVFVNTLGSGSGVTQISAGRVHTCAVVSGRAMCWGDNSSGQLGDDTTTQRNAPVQVAGLTSGVTQISAGHDHTCAVVNGDALCWGNGGDGRIGDGMATQRNTPVQVDDDLYD